MTKIKVLVADDSAFMRKVISDILTSDPNIEVVARARNGMECLEKVKEFQPDVVTLDVEMPILDGLATLERLMAEQPLPVVMLSSLTKEGADATLKALELGAFDFIGKPSGPISLDIHKVGQQLVELVKEAAVAKGRIKQKLTAPLTKTSVKKTQVEPQKKLRQTEKTSEYPSLSDKGSKGLQPMEMSDKTGTKVVFLGTSTGGPRALQTLLTHIPAFFPAPILIVQHMPPGFTKSLAQRLDSMCQITVKEASDGEEIKAGTAYIAPGGYHMEATQPTGGKVIIKLHQEAPRGGHRPSVDVLFESASKLTHTRQWAVILTGMGADGTAGLRQMKEAHHVVGLIEDQSSCVVYGMPRAAIQAGLADHVVPLDHMAETLVRLVT
ncbi:Chemotaxis response regulator protein-glutamate methylesterase CheB [Brevibacillus laterosporus]|uniref:Protein-glutamate methylesterase/protein-glutamine glutaminase n=1 Tax=Brevibacillus laterosporus TaxID=1465 RepID=A0A518VDE7_BRELA|nr:chemotaxis response regulator protein-glutamate methylesterase [Brevibacillus laterosporus]QDX94979.1 chemotaxis response regulator protein-glutamate methylesterase [Brevibacillus laterosporus]RAP30106.1 Chemotaxis response regulator protein-glutamate methylesterase CheB [Brevibacillus laterosporus]